MSNSCGANHGGGDKPSPMEQRMKARENMDRIKYKILVMSGKGGVGKTSVAVNLAHAFQTIGLNAGLMDVDIHGPNVPLMCGVEGAQAQVENERVVPVVTAGGVKVVSMSFFIPSAEEAVIWRGPVKMGAIQQFMGDVDWSGVDILLVDCPPGTGDEPLSVAQLLGPTLDGAIIVTTPQDVSLLDSGRSVTFAKKLQIRVLGILENMAGFVCPHCSEETDLFGKNGGKRAARAMEVPYLGHLPISAAMVKAGDAGTPLVLEAPEDPAAKMLIRIAEGLKADWDEQEANNV
jgi:ATP-binding protein involved in chromosome partitioning